MSKIKNQNSKIHTAGILDYGMGNLRSVGKALEAAGARVIVSDSQKKLAQSDVLVLPGQGNFGRAVSTLEKIGLMDFVKEWVVQGRPYLGICLGLQLLFERSEESPGIKGLSVMKGTVRKFRSFKSKYKIPHMGWNQAVPLKNAPVQRIVRLKEDFFYFVHSYYADPMDKSIGWTKTIHNVPFFSSVARGNMIATQFHPEKSGRQGQLFLQTLLTKYYF